MNHPIVCTSFYKMLQELRLEDYTANRKGVQQGSATIFGAAQPVQTPGFSFGQAKTTTFTGGRCHSNIGLLLFLYCTIISLLLHLHFLFLYNKFNTVISLKIYRFTLNILHFTLITAQMLIQEVYLQEFSDTRLGLHSGTL